MSKHLSREFKDQMKVALLAEKEHLNHELAQIGTSDPNNPAAFTPNAPELGTGEDENAAEVATYTDNLAVAEELQGALKDVNSALVNIEKGAYGICKYCSQPIDERRLVARPASSSCIACKKQMTREA
jgi:DnaK suppressor protein